MIFKNLNEKTIELAAIQLKELIKDIFDSEVTILLEKEYQKLKEIIE